MEETGSWAVDRLAAGLLFSALGLEEDAARLDLAARHFAEHRKAMVSWLATQVQGKIIGQLEDVSSSVFNRHDSSAETA